MVCAGRRSLPVVVALVGLLAIAGCTPEQTSVPSAEASARAEAGSDGSAAADEVGSGSVTDTGNEPLPSRPLDEAAALDAWGEEQECGTVTSVEGGSLRVTLTVLQGGASCADALDAVAVYDQAAPGGGEAVAVGREWYCNPYSDTVVRCNTEYGAVIIIYREATEPVSCGEIDSGTGPPLAITVTYGDIPCSEARAVMTRYYHDDDLVHSGSGSAANFDGWTCISGAGTETTGHAAGCESDHGRISADVDGTCAELNNRFTFISVVSIDIKDEQTYITYQPAKARCDPNVSYVALPGIYHVFVDDDAEILLIKRGPGQVAQWGSSAAALPADYAAQEGSFPFFLIRHSSVGHASALIQRS